MYAQCTYLCVDGSSCRYLSVYGSVQPIHSEAPVSRSREFQIRLFVIHSSPPSSICSVRCRVAAIS
ncbi:hypothetical protein NP493_1038g01022 [Ridgeia piscesae]|uniref:Uncharacterized protein n=1 Tax=Ridgeia piscesae TaxID=27915 RepID=A0AAD9NIM6_RIDPI|nr:hypothetical protein NP493_1038g01022 [Ridgeia piscesae]